MLTLMNPTGSGKVVKVYRVWAEIPSQILAITGVLYLGILARCNTVSGGVTTTPVSYDSSNTALGTVSSGSKRTATIVSTLRRVLFSNDEAVLNSATMDEYLLLNLRNEIWNSSTKNTDIQPLVLRENEGLTFQNTTATSVSFLDVFMEFTVE